MENQQTSRDSAAAVKPPDRLENGAWVHLVVMPSGGLVGAHFDEHLACVRAEAMNAVVASVPVRHDYRLVSDAR